MTAWSFCPTQVQDVLSNVKIKNKGTREDIDLYKKLWLDWTKDFEGPKYFKDWATCNGIHDALIQQIVHNKDKHFYTFTGDYLFYPVLLKPYQHTVVSWEQIDTIQSDSYIIVSQPNHIGCLIPYWDHLIRHCEKNNIKIFLDCAFFGTTLDKFIIDVYKNVIDCVAFSLSKNFMLGGIRAGIVFGNDLNPSLTIPTSVHFGYTYFNSTAVEVAKKLMPVFKSRYITEVAKPIQEQYCRDKEIIPCDIWMMGRDLDGSRINLIDNLKDTVQNELDKNGTI